VAYQVFGDGPVDVVLQTGWTIHLDVGWDIPEVARFLERLASFCRLIIFDRLGYGLSDPVDLDTLTLERWIEDTTAVMDACSSERAVLVGTCESGPAQILFSATHPARTAGLVLMNTMACGGRADGYPWGFPLYAAKRAAVLMRDFVLGEDNATITGAAPHLADDQHFVASYRRLIRAATSPQTAERLMLLCLTMDVRDVLSSVRSPTLVLHSRDQSFCRVDHGRYLAEHIDGAKYVEVPGGGLYPWWSDQDDMLMEIEEFATGARRAPETDRVLATVLFTDIVGSTQRASALGDRQWRELLDRHDAVVTRTLDEFRGRKVASIGRGDGVLATFDGPARGVRCARAIIDAVSDVGIDVRAGLHTGEVELRGEDIGGIAVHIADRVASQAGVGEVLVSRTVVDLVAGSELLFADRGTHGLKGLNGEWQLFAVER
jgi:class 3 adenylate cyclase